MFPHNLQNSQPNPLAPKPPIPEPPPIPDAVKLRARAQGATYIHQDGSKAYTWRYDKFLVAYEPDFEAWAEYDDIDLPAGEAVEL